MTSESGVDPGHLKEPVSGVELNSWRRGFTPQAEIWNGRMAMFGLLVGMSILIHQMFVRLLSGN